MRLTLPRGDWTMAVALALIVLTHVTLPAFRNKNFRDTANTSWNLARTWRGIPAGGPTSVEGDDPGPTMLMAGTIAMAYSRKDLTTFEALPHIPRVYFVLLVFVNALMMAVLYFAARALWGRWLAFGLIAAFTLGSNVRFLAFSGDVYLFPWYAGILMLAAFALFDSSARGARLALGACVVGIALSSLFRSGSSSVGLGFLLAAVWPRWIAGTAAARRVRRRALACGAALVLLCLARAVWLPQSHVVWHALHSGLLEFGGHRDAEGHAYPYFVPEADLPPGAEPVSNWSDSVANQLAEHARPGVVRYSAEYEEIVRQDVLRVVTRYPWGMTRLVSLRLWRLLIVNPWQRVSATSQLMPAWYDTPLRIVWIGVVVLGVVRGLGARTLMQIGALTPLLLPPLLVHTGYLMYNFSAHLVFYLLVACSLQVLLGGRGAQHVDGRPRSAEAR